MDRKLVQEVIKEFVGGPEFRTLVYQELERIHATPTTTNDYGSIIVSRITVEKEDLHGGGGGGGLTDHVS